MNRHSIIIGIKSFSLHLDEIELLKKKLPLGVILFKRNIKDPKQALKLTTSIKKILGKDVMILIDQEGGRVSRLNSDHWDTYPEASYFGQLAKKNLNKAKKTTFKNYKDIGKQLKDIGINFNCAPVLDLKFKGASSVIGNRAFSRNPSTTSYLSLEACKGLLSENVFPIIKHIPGHGRSKIDSHYNLPIIKSSKKVLQEDFYPFIKLKKMPLAMLAHIKYLDLDKIECATHSKLTIDYIKNQIGFKGILLSDDLCMKALTGKYYSRARKAIEAGCDIVLHCDPSISNIIKSCEGAGYVSNILSNKIKQLKNFL
ncbi:MAG: beta-N-acetylhexosaminidase [Pelagibacterales bacterium]|nr:beta-N-acetylhexosaminidase [Pelagibacterales bacterium]OUU61967.1 MAG: beta-N-acetylhexosaminidase [Alphaproteobacteria bacterium TMED62]|tara:strand:- start:12265 stop:13203 length:939 start_codon:yes stop_codon:yes gene_type:complete